MSCQRHTQSYSRRAGFSSFDLLLFYFTVSSTDSVNIEMNKIEIYIYTFCHKVTGPIKMVGLAKEFSIELQKKYFN